MLGLPLGHSNRPKLSVITVIISNSADFFSTLEERCNQTGPHVSNFDVHA